MELKLHTLLFMVGPTGAGKSTLAKQLKAQLNEQLAMDGYPPNAHIVSSDDTRRGLLSHDYHRHDQTMLQVSKQAFTLMGQQVDALMSWPIAAPFIIIDATNIMDQNRKPFLDLAKKHYYLADLIAFDYKDVAEYEKYLPPEFSRKILYRHIETFRKKFYSDDKRAYHKTHKITKKDFTGVKPEIVNLDYWKSTFLPPSTQDVNILSDIHGCLTEFKIALRKMGYGIEGNELIVPEVKRDDAIILLGDIIDKGPESPETIDFIHHNLNKFTIVIGNHENFIRLWFDGKILEGSTPEDVLERYFTCTKELKGDEDRLSKFKDIMKVSLPFIRNKFFFANHAPCESKFFGKIDSLAMKSQRNFRIPRADVTEGLTPDHVIEATKKAWETGLKFWEEQAETNYPYHFVGHLPLSKASRIKNQFMIDGGLPNGGSLITVQLKYGDRPFLTYTPKQTETKFPERLFSIFDGDPRHRIEVADLDDLGKRRLKFAVENKINFISGTMSPVDKLGDNLESIEQGFEYYRRVGVSKVVLQQKYMGSRCNLYLNRDATKCYATSRGGYKIRPPEESSYTGVDLTDVFTDQLKVLSPYMESNDIEWMIIDGELLPWHVLGAGLIEETFKPIEFAIASEALALENTGFEEALAKVMAEMKDSGFTQDQSTMPKKDLAEKYTHHKYSIYNTLLRYPHVPLAELAPAIKTYSQQIKLYGQPGSTTFKGFAVLKEIFGDGTERTFFDGTNLEVYKLTGNTDPCAVIDLKDEKDLEIARGFYKTAVEANLEGIVMKPEAVYLHKVAPYLKVRNPDYLTIIYGYDYKTATKYQKLLRQKRIEKKIRTSIAEFEIGKGMLEIPRAEISEDNTKYTNLIARMITQEKLEKEIDPRL